MSQLFFIAEHMLTFDIFLGIESSLDDLFWNKTKFALETIISHILI